MKDFPKRARCVDWRDGVLIFDNGASIEASDPTIEITERLGALSGMVSFHACGVPFACAGWSHDDPEIRAFLRRFSDFYLETVQELEPLLFGA